MKSWIAALLGSFAGLVIGAFTLYGAGDAGGREVVYLIGSAGVGAFVGFIAFITWQWCHRGATWQLLWAALVGATNGFLLSLVSVICGLTPGVDMVKSLIMWSAAGGALGILIVCAVWFQWGEVPFRRRN